MNANENNNTINQEVYDGVKEVMLQEGVIAKLWYISKRR